MKYVNHLVVVVFFLKRHHGRAVWVFIGLQAVARLDRKTPPLILVTGKVEIFFFPNRRHPQYLSLSFEVVIPTPDHCQDENHACETSTAAAGPAVGMVSLASIAEQLVSAYHAIRGFENGLEL